MPGESLVTNGAPNTLLVKSIQLMLIVHVMVFSPDVSKSGLANVTFVNGFCMGHRQMVAQNVGASEDGLADMTLVGGR